MFFFYQNPFELTIAGQLKHPDVKPSEGRDLQSIIISLGVGTGQEQPQDRIEATLSAFFLLVR